MEFSSDLAFPLPFSGGEKRAHVLVWYCTLHTIQRVNRNRAALVELRISSRSIFPPLKMDRFKVFFSLENWNALFQLGYDSPLFAISPDAVRSSWQIEWFDSSELSTVSFWRRLVNKRWPQTLWRPLSESILKIVFDWIEKDMSVCYFFLTTSE